MFLQELEQEGNRLISERDKLFYCEKTIDKNELRNNLRFNEKG